MSAISNASTCKHNSHDRIVQATLMYSTASFIILSFFSSSGCTEIMALILLQINGDLVQFTTNNSFTGSREKQLKKIQEKLYRTKKNLFFCFALTSVEFLQHNLDVSFCAQFGIVATKLTIFRPNSERSCFCKIHFIINN